MQSKARVKMMALILSLLVGASSVALAVGGAGDAGVMKPKPSAHSVGGPGDAGVM